MEAIVVHEASSPLTMAKAVIAIVVTIIDVAEARRPLDAVICH